jgi:hypothetical protein
MRDTATDFELTDLAKILGVDDSLYKIEWDKNELLKKTDLYITFQSASIKPKSDLETRKQNFKQKIFDLVKSAHEIFVENLRQKSGKNPKKRIYIQLP